jgi:hypothetical protein
VAIVDTGGKKFVGETDDVKGAHCYEVCYGVDRVGQVGQSGILMMGREVVVGCFGCFG